MSATLSEEHFSELPSYFEELARVTSTPSDYFDELARVTGTPQRPENCKANSAAKDKSSFVADFSGMLTNVSKHLVRIEMSSSENHEAILKIMLETQKMMTTTLQCLGEVKAAVTTSLRMRSDESCEAIAEEGLRISANPTPRQCSKGSPAANHVRASAPRSAMPPPVNGCVVLPERADPKEPFNVCPPILELAMHPGTQQAHKEGLHLTQPANQNSVDNGELPLEELTEFWKAALQASLETIEKEMKSHMAAMQNHLEDLAPKPGPVVTQSESSDSAPPATLDQPDEDLDDATWGGSGFDLNAQKMNSLDDRSSFTQMTTLMQQLSHHKNRPLLQKVVDSKSYQLAMICFVAMQAIGMGVELELKMEHFSDVYHASSDIVKVPNLYWFNFALNSIFILDLVIRMLAWKSEFILTSDREALAWNVFDSCLVVLSVCDYFEDIGFGASARILRCMRLFRAVRVMRMISFFKELKKMISTFVSGLGHLCWIAFLLFIFLYVFALLFMQQAAAKLEDMGDARLQNLHNVTVASDKYADFNHEIPMIFLYSSLKTMMLNLFATITGGLEWTVVLNPLIDSSDIYYWVSVAYVLLFILGFLSVVTGMFVDRAAVQILKTDMELAKTRRLLEDHRAMQRIFDLLGLTQEINDDGTYIDAEQMIKILYDRKIQDWLVENKVDTNRDFSHVIAMHVSTDATGCSIRDFLTSLRRLAGNALSFDLSLLTFESRRAFDRTLAYNRRQYQDMRRVMEGINRLEHKFLKMV